MTNPSGVVLIHCPWPRHEIRCTSEILAGPLNGGRLMWGENMDLWNLWWYSDGACEDMSNIVKPSSKTSIQGGYPWRCLRWDSLNPRYGWSHGPAFYLLYFTVKCTYIYSISIYIYILYILYMKFIGCLNPSSAPRMFALSHVFSCCNRGYLWYLETSIPAEPDKWYGHLYAIVIPSGKTYKKLWKITIFNG